MRWLVAFLLLISPVSAQSVDQGLATAPSIQSSAPAGFNSIGNIFTVDFAKDFGLISSLLGLAGTVTVNGLRTTDTVLIQCISALPAGVTVGNARVTANDTLEVRFAGNATLGSLNYRLIVFRP